MTLATDPQFSAAAAELGATEPAAPTKAVVHTQPDTRLEQLCAQYAMAKAEAAKADEALKAITDGIKAELTLAAPGATSIDLLSPDLARPLRLVAVESWRVDSKKLKAEQPLLYVTYAKKSTAWTLKAVGAETA